MQTINFKDVRPTWSLPQYPPYHRGPNLEEYFYKFYMTHRPEFDATGYTLIPIFWTMCYWQNRQLQPYLDALPKDKKYFAVSQHADAIKEKLPEGSVAFCSGGNNGGIPLPHVTSGVPEKYRPDLTDIEDLTGRSKKHFCSFTGAVDTHKIRKELHKQLHFRQGYVFNNSSWELDVPQEKQDLFMVTTRNTKFTLCPRGYGPQSFRTYESIQLGSVPVYIHDDNKWLPFDDIVPWDKFAVLVHVNDIDLIDRRLRQISDMQYMSMRAMGTIVYNTLFSLGGVSQQILKHLQNERN